MKLKIFLHISFLFTIFFSFTASAQSEQTESFRFSIAADMRGSAGEENDSINKFRGALEALKIVGAGEFMLSPGDIDPPSNIRWSIDKYLGPEFIWYPILGNHEIETKSDMDYLRDYNRGGNKLPYIVNKGPKGTEETMYSFDFKNSHFIILNQYYDGNCDTCTDGNISDPVFSWLKSDLEKTKQENIFVLGHEPAFAQPDEQTGRVRHNGDSLDKYRKSRDRFWSLLEEQKVIAYFCGHTHNYSSVIINSVWQIDSGHAQGGSGKGGASTFLTLDVSGDEVNVTVYRDIHDGNYEYNGIVKSYRIK